MHTLLPDLLMESSERNFSHLGISRVTCGLGNTSIYKAYTLNEETYASTEMALVSIEKEKLHIINAPRRPMLHPGRLQYQQQSSTTQQLPMVIPNR